MQLEQNVKRRYIQKISVIGVDPTAIDGGVKQDTECLSLVEVKDLFSYLPLETSFYTKEQFKIFKKLGGAQVADIWIRYHCPRLRYR